MVIIASMHPFPIPAYPIRVQGCWSQSHLAVCERRGTPWTETKRKEKLILWAGWWFQWKYHGNGSTGEQELFLLWSVHLLMQLQERHPPKTLQIWSLCLTNLKRFKRQTCHRPKCQWWGKWLHSDQWFIKCERYLCNAKYCVFSDLSPHHMSTRHLNYTVREGKILFK